MANPSCEREKQTGNPVNPYREFARRQAQALGQSPEIVKAVVGFATETYFVDRKIGPPKFHHRQAIKEARGLTEDEIAHAAVLAVDSYNACRAARGETTEEQIQELTPGALRMWKENAEQQRLATEKRGVAEEASKRRVLRERLQQSFARVMEPSDDQLRINNANRELLRTKTRRIDFMADPVYAAMRDRRSEFHSRSLREEEYEDLNDQIAIAKDTIKLTIRSRVDVRALTDSVSEALLRNRDLRARLGGDGFNHFSDFVLRLLEGRQVSAQEIRGVGLDPNEILKTARLKYSGFALTDAEEKWRTRLDVRTAEIRSNWLVR